MLLRSVCILFAITSFAHAEQMDVIDFGNAKSEKAHRFEGNDSEPFAGAMQVSARRLLPLRSESWRGGAMQFRMQVDPDSLNYVTVKFWGGDLTGESSRLMLFVDGKQVGQRHLAEVDPLDILDGHAARAPDRFFYKTFPLPQNLTDGKKEVLLAIMVEGSIWGYGDTLERWQKKVEKPSRGIYRCYTHTDSFLEIDKREKQGKPPKRYPTRSQPGIEVLDEVMKTVNDRIDHLVHREKRRVGGNDMLLIARACWVPWTKAYRNVDALNKVVRSIDRTYMEYAEDSTILQKEWHGYGSEGEAVSILGKPLERYLDHNIEGTNIQRREAWTQMLVASRDWHLTHRRSYTNQAMTVDFNIYRCNRGIAALNPDAAWPEKKAVRILYEAIGIEPWSGSHTEGLGRPDWPLGKKFMQTTDQGLTRELGYVGGYGEITVPICRDIYAVTKPTYDGEGDERIKEQLLKMAKARAAFRYPAVDDEGFRAMRIEHTIGWRDWHYPGPVTYGQTVCDDGGPIDTAAETMDPDLIGYAQQMMDDNQYYVAVKKKLLERRGGNKFKALLRVPGNFEKLRQASPEKKRLPMADGQPDFVFADTGVGAVAFKHGDNRLFASLYWRARYGINNLARIHFMTPTEHRDSTIQIQTSFNDSGHIYTIPNRTNSAFTDHHEDHYKKAGMDFGMTGLTYPIAVVPRYMKDYRPGKENFFAGKGNYYLMIYGPYCVAMNCTSKSTRFPVPREFQGAEVLFGEKSELKSKYRLGGNETVVLYRGKD